MELQTLIDALQSKWTPSDGARLTLKKGRHIREVQIPASCKQDIWIFSGRVDKEGEAALIGRINCADLIATTNRIPDLGGWAIV